jgi:hypothetical protein
MSILGFNLDTSNVPKMESSQTIGGKIQEASKAFNEFLNSSPEDKNSKEGLVSEDNGPKLVIESTKIIETDNSENIEEAEQLVEEDSLIDNQIERITDIPEQKSSVNGQSVNGSLEPTDSTSLSNSAEKKQLLGALNNSIYKGKFIYDQIETDQIETDQIETDQIETDQIETDQIETDQIETDQIELLDEVNTKNNYGSKFQNHTKIVIKNIGNATNKVMINDEVTLNPTTESTLEEITIDSEISQEDGQLNVSLKGIESSSKSIKGSIFHYNTDQNKLEQIKELATERLSTKNKLIEEKSKVNLDTVIAKDLSRNNLNLDQIISSPLFPIQIDQLSGKNTSKTTESNDTIDQTFINSTSKDLNNNVQMNEISKVQRTSFNEHISKIMDQKEMISKLWSKSYVEFENGQRVDVFARKYENEFQFRIETNQSELQQKIENEVDKIKEGLQNKFETDINFFFGKNDDSQSNEGTKSSTQKLNLMKDSDYTKDEVSDEGISQKSLGYNSNEWVA